MKRRRALLDPHHHCTVKKPMCILGTLISTAGAAEALAMPEMPDHYLCFGLATRRRRWRQPLTLCK